MIHYYNLNQGDNQRDGHTQTMGSLSLQPGCSDNDEGLRTTIIF